MEEFKSMINSCFIVINSIILMGLVVLLIVLLYKIRQVKKSESILSETLQSIDEELNKKNRKEQAIRDALAYGVTAYYVLEWDTEQIIDFYVADESIRELALAAVEKSTFTEAITKMYKRHIIPEERDVVLEKLSIDNVRKKLEEQFKSLNVNINEEQLSAIECICADRLRGISSIHQFLTDSLSI